MSNKPDPFSDAIKQLNISENETYTSTELMKISAITEGIKQLQDFRNIFSVTTLTANEAVLFSKAQVIGEFWNIKQIDKILRGLATMKLSINGKRADQIVNILIGMNRKKTTKEKVTDFIKGGERD